MAEEGVPRKNVGCFGVLPVSPRDGRVGRPITTCRKREHEAG